MPISRHTMDPFMLRFACDIDERTTDSMPLHQAIWRSPFFSGPRVIPFTLNLANNGGHHANTAE